VQQKEMAMNKINKSITVNAPVHAVFGYICKPRNFLKLCSNLIAVEDIEQLPSEAKGFQWEYKMVNVHFFGTSDTTEYDVNQCLVSVIEGGITGTITWLFQTQNESTQVTLIIEYVLPYPFVKKHGAKTIARENEAGIFSLLESLKSAIEHEVESKVSKQQ
jgi:uncharacterized membrane protein